MHGEIVVAGTDEDKILDETLSRLRLPREAVDYEVTREDDEFLLPGAKPQIQLHIRVRSEFIAEQAVQHLGNILRIVDIEADVQTDERDGITFIHVDSKDAAALLIGRDGQNLDALQYLIERMVVRVGRETPLIIIDVENYRRRQFEKLESLAARAVDRARQTGNEIELTPMPPLERKFLHHYLRGQEDIKTLSRGEEPERYLVLYSDLKE